MLLLSREIQVLKMVDHPNIVYLREIFETPEVGSSYGGIHLLAYTRYGQFMSSGEFLSFFVGKLFIS